MKCWIHWNTVFWWASLTLQSAIYKAQEGKGPWTTFISATWPPGSTWIRRGVGALTMMTFQFHFTQDLIFMLCSFSLNPRSSVRTAENADSTTTFVALYRSGFADSPDILNELSSSWSKNKTRILNISKMKNKMPKSVWSHVHLNSSKIYKTKSAVWHCDLFLFVLELKDDCCTRQREVGIDVCMSIELRRNPTIPLQTHLLSLLAAVDNVTVHKELIRTEMILR